MDDDLRIKLLGQAIKDGNFKCAVCLSGGEFTEEQKERLSSVIAEKAFKGDKEGASRAPSSV